MESMMKRKIALIALVPDSGHVIPLLKLGVAFRQRNYDIQCFLPQECAGLTEAFPLAVSFFGPVAATVDATVFYRLSQKSLFYNAFSFYKDVKINYLQPMAFQVLGCLETLKKQLEQFEPPLIIADCHLLPELLQYLARYLGSKLIFHNGHGNCGYPNYHNQKDYRMKIPIRGEKLNFNYHRILFNYGYTGWLPALQRLIIWRGEAIDRRCRRQLTEQTKNYEAECALALRKSFPGVNHEQVVPLYINTGLAFIERELLEPQPDRLPIQCFPPLPDPRSLPLQPRLLQWLEAAGTNPVVYICMGTMVQVNRRFIRCLIEGLWQLGVFVLWSLPSAQAGWVKQYGQAKNLHVETFLPQDKVLALEQVRCFITHAGAGAIQDGLLNGKPMLCIPFMFDQPFNSSVIELLGAGIKLWKRQVSAKSVRDSVGKLLHQPEYGEAARQWMMKIRARDSGGEISRWCEEFFKGDEPDVMGKG